MNLKFILTYSVLLSASCIANSQELQWSKIAGTDKEEYSLNHLIDKSGNIYISGKTTGSFNTTNKGMNDGFLLKMDDTGKVLWSRQFGSAMEDDVQWSAIDNSGNIYITGFTLGSLSGQNKGKEDIFLVKYRSDGNMVWQKQIGTDSTDVAKGICTDSDGYVYLTGFTGGKLGERQIGKNDAFIMKLDNKGDIININQFGTPENDMGYSVVTGMNHDLFICGTTSGIIEGRNNGMMDSFTGHFSLDLKSTGFKQFGSAGFDIALVLHTDQSNNVYVGGSTSGDFAGAQAGEGDCFLLKQDPEGKIIWKKQFGTSHHDGVRGIDITDKVLISGILNLPPEKAFIHIYTFEGNLLWEKTFETNQPDAGTSGKDIIGGKDGFTHLGLTGSTLFGPLVGGHDMYLVKYKWK